MVDVLTRVFRTFAPQGQVRKELGSAPSVYSTLMVGEPEMSRSLLLLSAVTAASQLGLKVVFFTRTHIQQLPTFLQRRVPALDPESLKVLSGSYYIFYRCFRTMYIFWCICRLLFVVALYFNKVVGKPVCKMSLSRTNDHLAFCFSLQVIWILSQCIK